MHSDDLATDQRLIHEALWILRISQNRYECSCYVLPRNCSLNGD